MFPVHAAFSRATRALGPVARTRRVKRRLRGNVSIILTTREYYIQVNTRLHKNLSCYCLFGK